MTISSSFRLVLVRVASLARHGFAGLSDRMFFMTADLLLRRPTRAFPRTKTLAAGLAALLLVAVPCTLQAENSDCLSCHAVEGLENVSGHNVSVNTETFQASVHGGLSCTDCHTSIKKYPHPDHPKSVQCATCHADAAAGIAGSVHNSTAVHSCTSCHGDAHAIFPKDDPRSAVYPLNIPRTCGSCHGKKALTGDRSPRNVYSAYMDSIHGYAVSKEGLLVAANCMSCHGSHHMHHILGHNDPLSPTYKTNIPNTCGKCHGGIEAEYLAGIHGRAIEGGNLKAPVCTDCHAAHAILQSTLAAFRMQSTPICGSCHKDKFATYQDTFHSQLGLLGGYVQTARCWDCHGAHEVLPASDPRSPIAQANLVKTCGKCHAGANASFVRYQPHANARIRKLNPELYYIRLFMNLLLASVLTFFLIHSVLWLVRARIVQIKSRHAKGGKNA